MVLPEPVNELLIPTITSCELLVVGLSPLFGELLDLHAAHCLLLDLVGQQFFKFSIHSFSSSFFCSLAVGTLIHLLNKFDPRLNSFSIAPRDSLFGSPAFFRIGLVFLAYSLLDQISLHRADVLHFHLNNGVG